MHSLETPQTPLKKTVAEKKGKEWKSWEVVALVPKGGSLRIKDYASFLDQRKEDVRKCPHEFKSEGDNGRGPISLLQQLIWEGIRIDKMIKIIDEAPKDLNVWNQKLESESIFDISSIKNSDILRIQDLYIGYISFFQGVIDAIRELDRNSFGGIGRCIEPKKLLSEFKTEQTKALFTMNEINLLFEIQGMIFV